MLLLFWLRTVAEFCLNWRGSERATDAWLGVWKLCNDPGFDPRLALRPAAGALHIGKIGMTSSSVLLKLILSVQVSAKQTVGDLLCRHGATMSALGRQCTWLTPARSWQPYLTMTLPPWLLIWMCSSRWVTCESSHKTRCVCTAHAQDAGAFIVHMYDPAAASVGAMYKLQVRLSNTCTSCRCVRIPHSRAVVTSVFHTHELL